MIIARAEPQLKPKGFPVMFHGIPFRFPGRQAFGEELDPRKPKGQCAMQN